MQCCGAVRCWLPASVLYEYVRRRLFLQSTSRGGELSLEGGRQDDAGHECRSVRVVGAFNAPRLRLDHLSLACSVSRFLSPPLLRFSICDFVMRRQPSLGSLDSGGRKEKGSASPSVSFSRSRASSSSSSSVLTSGQQARLNRGVPHNIFLPYNAKKKILVS